MPETQVLCTPIGQVSFLSSKSDDLVPDYGFENRVFLYNNGYEKIAKKLALCGTRTLHFETANGHWKYVRATCNLPFCPRCGKTGSKTHKQTVLRAIDRLLLPGPLGGWVFTMPKTISESMLSKEDVDYLQQHVSKILLRNLEIDGLCIKEHTVGRVNRGLHQHFHALTPLEAGTVLGRIPASALAEIKQEWRDTLNARFELNLESVDVEYRFALTENEKIHSINYALRPIVTAKHFFYLSDEQKHYILSRWGIHRVRWYGQLSNNKYKQYLLSRGIDPTKHQEADILTRKLCPVDGLPYKYVGTCPAKDLPFGQGRWWDENVFVDHETYLALKREQEWQDFLDGKRKTTIEDWTKNQETAEAMRSLREYEARHTPRPRKIVSPVAVNSQLEEACLI